MNRIDKYPGNNRALWIKNESVRRLCQSVFTGAVWTILLLIMIIPAWSHAENGTTDYDTYIQKGLHGMYEKDFTTAIKNFKAAVKFDPDTAKAYYYLGYVYFSTGKMEKAMEFFNEAYIIDPTYTPNPHKAN